MTPASIRYKPERMRESEEKRRGRDKKERKREGETKKMVQFGPATRQPHTEAGNTCLGLMCV